MWTLQSRQSAQSPLAAPPSPSLPDVLDQLVVAGERLETLLALVRLHLWPASYALASQLHGRLGHQILELNNS